MNNTHYEKFKTALNANVHQHDAKHSKPLTIRNEKGLARIRSERKTVKRDQRIEKVE